jgi:hypothetical protein
VLYSSLLLFTSRAFLASLCSREQQLAYVEAENSVLLRWVPGADGASGATGYEGSIEILWPVFVFGKGKRPKQGKGVVSQDTFRGIEPDEGPDALTVD